MPSVNDRQPEEKTSPFDPTGPLRPKGLCVCNDGSNQSGFLLHDTDLKVYCAIPIFFPDGSFADAAPVCTPFTVLAK